MKRNRVAVWLSRAAMASVLLAGVLCCGYFGRWGIYLGVIPKSPPIGGIVYDLRLDRGRIYYSRFDDSNPSFGNKSKPVMHLSWLAEFDPPGPNRIKENSLRFRWQAYSSGLPRTKLFQVFFPIWCVLVPCLIFPVMWLRKRRRPEPAGFEVIGNAT